MNSDEVCVIKRTWEIPMSDPSGSGAAILIKYFTKHPSHLEKFAAFKDVPISELNDNARFRAHGVRIIRVFDESIQSLGHDWAGDKLEEIWTKIAQSHFTRQIEKQAFSDLKEIILEVLTAACSLTKEQTETWLKMLDTVYDIIFNALDQLEAAK